VNRLNDLIFELSMDPFFRDQFERAPEDVLRAAGLAPGALEALAQPGAHLPGTDVSSWHRSVGFFDPGPDPLPDGMVPDQGL
jgi:hypothetical protein